MNESEHMEIAVKLHNSLIGNLKQMRGQHKVKKYVEGIRKCGRCKKEFLSENMILPYWYERASAKVCMVCYDALKKNRG